MSQYSDNLASDPNHVWNRIVELVPADNVVLDVGCSSGNLGAMLIAQKNCVVDGIEIDPDDAAIAAKKLRQVWTYNVNEATQLARIKTKYDVLIFADVLEHLVAPSDTLKRVKRLLKPGGRVVFSLPNMTHISVRLALLGGSFESTDLGVLDKTHLHFYDEAEIRRLFGEAGMAIVELLAVAYPYPPQLIETRLTQLGLKPTVKGLKLLNQPSATAFQYAGYATYSAKKIKSTARPVQAVHNDVQKMAETLASTEAKLVTARQTEKTLRQHVTELQSRIDIITNSKFYKAAKLGIRAYRKSRSALGRREKA